MAGAVTNFMRRMAITTTLSPTGFRAWLPTMTSTAGNHKQFLGQGEFSLIFGNYKVAITVPDDHVVAASGECQNYNQVLTSDQKKRMKDAENSTTPVIIVTQDEAIANEKNKPTGKKTWVYKADNVRDFAFASSRKFIWDAMKTDVYGNGRKIWSMSYYPKEGNPLWEQYSTRRGGAHASFLRQAHIRVPLSGRHFVPR